MLKEIEGRIRRAKAHRELLYISKENIHVKGQNDDGTQHRNGAEITP